MAVVGLVLILAATTSVFSSSCNQCCNSLQAVIAGVEEDLEALQNASSRTDDVIGDLEGQVSSLHNQTDEQQSALATLTSECDCLAFQQHLDTLNASLIALLELVDNLTLQAPVLANGTLRLVNDINNSSNQGRVEIYVNGMWGTVCQDSWSRGDAIVACNQLRLPSGNPVVLFGTNSPISPFGRGVGPIWLDNLSCTGSEISLLVCPTSGNGVGMTNCDHSEDVGVICQD